MFLREDVSWHSGIFIFFIMFLREGRGNCPWAMTEPTHLIYSGVDEAACHGVLAFLGLFFGYNKKK